VGSAIQPSSSVCTVNLWKDHASLPVAYRLPWYDWARLRLQGCEKPQEFDAGDRVSMAVTDSEWFFDSSAA
jgi:hypothetical protein